MSQPDQPDHPGAEVVPLRAAEVDGTQTVPAVVDSATVDQAPVKPVAVYADVTQPAERRAIVPLPLQRANLRGTVSYHGGLLWHRSRYHGLRLVFYVIAMLVWAVVGCVRLAARQLRWWWVMEQHQLRSQAVAAGEIDDWLRLHKAAGEARKVRGVALAAEAVALVVLVVVLTWFAPWQAQATAVAVAVILAALFGRPAGHPIVGKAVIPPDYSPPTHPVIERALGSLGISEINKALKPDKDGRAVGIRFVSDVMRDGPGWSCQVDLPHGVTASHILAKRSELASGLRRPLSATWPEGVPHEHEGRLNLWVGMSDISKAKPATWPLLKVKSTDVFGTLPFGTDPRGRPVTVPLFETNWLLGAAPGQGKTSAVRGLACGVALDVVADLWTHELAGKGDLEPLAKVSHRYCSGLDDEAVSYAADSLRLLRTELDRRSAALKKVPREARPDGSVTRELAGQRHLGLRPLVCFVDEAQNLFMHPVFGEQAREDAAYVIRLGRAYGVILVLATQRPDAKTMPTAVTGNITCRFCLQVPGQPENDMILGTSAYRSGYDSAVFRPGVDVGLGWLKANALPQIVRTYKTTLPDTEKVAARARDMRDRAGVLTGYALGLDEAAEARDVLADTLAVFGTDPGLHWDELADRLASRWPERYADLTGEAVSAQLRSHGVPSVMVSTSGVKARGCRRVAVEREVAR